MKLNPEAIDLATLRSSGPARKRASTTPRCSASPPPPPRSTASSPAARPSTASTPASACSPTPASPTTASPSFRPTSSCRTAPGLGDPLPRHVTRLMIVLKLLGLGRGYSGVRPLVIDALQALLDKDAMPVIPSQGSVGASGDLAPLAHLISALMGFGEIDLAGETMPAAAALQKLGMAPLAARPQGRTGADQRHAGLDRDRARCPVRRRARVRRGDRRRRAVGRCAQGQHQAVRRARFAASRPARADPRRRRHPRPARRQRDRRQPRPLRPGAGPLQLPLPAPGDGRGARPADQRRAHADHRSRRGDRQPDRLPGRGQRHLAAAISTPSRSPSPPT